MAIKMEMVGQTFGPFEREYDFKELMLLGLGCGAGADGKTDLEYVYEKDLKVLPIFGAMPIVDQIVTKTIDYGYNYAGSLHWGFDVKFHQPITKTSGKLSTYVLLKGLYDRGAEKGLLAQHVGDTYDESGTLLFTNESWDCLIYDGGFGGPKPPKDIVEIPDREPDYEVSEQIPLNQALIYRLQGDYHPQHADWEYAAEIGYEKPILHAVSTAGVACRHIIKTLFPGEPERLTRFKTRITSPLLPGCTIKTQMWKMGDNLIHFRVIDAETQKVYLNWALVEWK
ncbi:MAG: MaoC/PaaZ C-terminal domain-containing protein [Bacillota bacterium]|nr:MaoC/PaaZ C-terminal domain-containing protein [Bacillota bacterium]